MNLSKLVSETHKQLVKKQKLSQFLVLVSFVLTYAIIRTITHLQKANIIPNQNGPFHIHHMVPGILLLLISGYIVISYGTNEKVRHIMAILFGIGAALTLDEFSLWLFLQNVYWAKQGRDSVDVVIITIIIFSLLLLVNNVKYLSRKKN